MAEVDDNDDADDDDMGKVLPYGREPHEENLQDRGGETFDYNVFHGDFKVESWTLEQLVDMHMKNVPAIRVKRNYEVGWKDEAGVARALTLAECRGNFGVDRIPALRTRHFWTAATEGSTRMERYQTP
ncbi:hypothetical protein CYMTET_53354 [Cymbomonas tetramitiformis]|uniref:Uncharacterized protein n=1 Tax=Cymbomonas tetramitiformis TaxID=36881 RepID=A0AAE0BI92_9CHLO|nr:hypothetical protein CYMTET_53354 [Cymbomonas tetramitiformis]|eukprot:gene12271-14491_t